MNGFESFDLRCWAESGLTFTLPKKHPTQQKVATRRSIKTCIMITATAAIVSLAAQNFRAEPSQAILNWLTPITAENGVLDRDIVAVGYWPKLTSAMKSAPLLLDDDYSMDPDPIV